MDAMDWFLAGTYTAVILFGVIVTLIAKASLKRKRIKRT